MNEIEIHKIVKNRYPNEAVIGVRLDGSLIELDNISKTPSESFEIRRMDSVTPLKALIHSHPDGELFPSKCDMESQINMGIPWAIITTNGKDCSRMVWFGDQIEKLPLVGRPYVYGVYDCYSLIRDFYKEEYKIEIPDFPREWGWWENEDMYLDKFTEAGFEEISESEIKRGDVFLVKIRSSRINHGGIYLGNEKILHHLTSTCPVDLSRLSKSEPIHRWRLLIQKWLRKK